MSQKRRVVVTGMGMISPLGLNYESSWQGILNSKSGIKPITHFDASPISCRIAGTVTRGENGFNPEAYIEPRDVKKMDTFIHYGLAAAQQAIEDSGWEPKTEEDLENTGVLIGSGIGGLGAIENNSLQYHNSESKKLSPFFIPSCLINLVSGHLSIKYGYRGPNHSVVTACATGVHAIGDAARLIEYGDANIMVAGSAEAAVTPVGMAGFAAARALSTSYNDTPEKASRPWDKKRDGFVMGEGAGIVVLEEYEHAKKRGAKIYGEVIGYGLSGDAYHMTAPHPEGLGSTKAMKTAMKHGSINTSDIQYINAHGTSTPMGDMLELGAVQRLFVNDLNSLMMSSTKSSIGHLLGAAGSVEAIFSLLAIRDNIAPPTLNLEEPEDGIEIDLVPNVAKEANINCVLSNSFGFGGTNASIIFRRI